MLSVALVLRQRLALRSHLPLQVKKYWQYQGDLSVGERLILKGFSIVVSSALERPMFELTHDGHQGPTDGMIQLPESRLGYRRQPPPADFVASSTPTLLCGGHSDGSTPAQPEAPDANDRDVLGSTLPGHLQLLWQPKPRLLRRHYLQPNRDDLRLNKQPKASLSIALPLQRNLRLVV
ncbi:hypothetical protein MRX96_015926 [Rhipicephalus microplus]